MVIGSVALSACGSGDRNPMAANEQGAVSAPSMPAASAPPLVPPAAPQGPSLGEADSQNGQFRLSVTEAVRTGGVLTIKARVTLLGGETGSRRLLYSSDNEDLYVLAGDQKYMMLKDNEGVALAPKDFAPKFDQLGGGATWWGKFPAPPPEVKAVGFYFKDFAPVENVAIKDI
jgi:hypothetical protein